MFIGLGSGFFSDNALFIHPSHEIMLDTEFGVATLFKLLPLVFTVSLSVVSIVLSEYLSTMLIYFKLSRVGYNIFSFFNQRFLIELFYNRFITGLVLKLGGQTTKVIDKGSVELLGPYGLENILCSFSTCIDRLSTGVVTSYALYIVIAITLYMIIPISSGIVCILMITIAGLVLSQKSGSLYNLPKSHVFTNLPLQSGFLTSLFSIIIFFVFFIILIFIFFEFLYEILIAKLKRIARLYI